MCLPICGKPLHRRLRWRFPPSLAVKLPLLPCLLAFLGAGSLALAQLPVPDRLQPSATAPGGAEVDKLAEEAQRSVFEAADKQGGKPSAGGTPGAVPPVIQSGPSRGSYAVPALTAREDPALWPRDSVHKIAIIEVAFGGNTEEIIIELYPNSAPQTVANFVNLSESKFYDGLAFHRAIEGFLVQTGDPLTADEEKREQWGTGGEDRTLPAEIKRPHRLGSVAMARRNDSVNPSKRSNSSQFYFALGHYPFLDGNYTVFGQVVSGIDTIQYISRMPVDSNDCPIGRIELSSVRVTDHRGPLVSKAIAGRRGYQKPGSKGFVGRFLSRVW